MNRSKINQNMKGKFQNYFKTPGANMRKSAQFGNVRGNRREKKTVFERFFEGLCCAEGDNFYNV